MEFINEIKINIEIFYKCKKNLLNFTKFFSSIEQFESNWSSRFFPLWSRNFLESVPVLKITSGIPLLYFFKAGENVTFS